MKFAVQVTALALALFGSRSEACSDFVLNATTADRMVSARTMDFGIDLTTVVEVIPRGAVLQEPPAYQCADCADVHWTVKHGFVAMNVMGFNVAIDGMNEQGLSAAWLMVNDSQVPTHPVLNAAKEETGVPVISSLCTYLLGNFATVKEVRAALGRMQIAPIDAFAVFNDRRLQHAPLHVSIHDAERDSLVIELMDGHVKIFEDAEDVLTNAPPLEKKRQALLDNGFDHVPGGYSSTERFVRLSVLNARLGNADKKEALAHTSFMQGSDEQRDLAEALQLVHSVVAVPGTSTPTQWSVVRDHLRRKIYFLSTQNYVPRLVDLTKLDYDNAKARRMLPIAFGDWFVDVTDTLQHQTESVQTYDLPPRSHMMQLQRLVASFAEDRTRFWDATAWLDSPPSGARIFTLGIIYGMSVFVGVLAARNVYRRYELAQQRKGYQVIPDDDAVTVVSMADDDDVCV